MKRIYKYFRNDIVLIISMILALISMLLCPPSLSYLEYIDFKVIILLFCLMAVIVGFTRTGIFEILSRLLIERAGNTRALALILTLLCFFSSMLITNDVALILFVPLTISILSVYKHKGLIAIVVMETVAANLGSMLTPIGNPQNLYLYSYFNLDAFEFLRIVYPFSIVSLLLIITAILFIKGHNIELHFKENIRALELKKVILFSILFLVCLLTVFGILNYYFCFFIVFITILLTDKPVFKNVDYGLLMTFVCFFIFVGNLSNVTVIKETINSVLTGKEIIYSSILSQFISNVPAAIMLSKFTENYKALIIGTNIGGLGTLVASLASLISFKYYIKSEGAKVGRYIFTFTFVNILFFVVLISVSLLIS